MDSADAQCPFQHILYRYSISHVDDWGEAIAVFELDKLDFLLSCDCAAEAAAAAGANPVPVPVAALIESV